MTPEDKEAAKAKLREDLIELKLNTFGYWFDLFRMDEAQRKNCGYSKGPEAMLQQLMKNYQKQHDRLLKPFDRGDFD